jgi:hypothetical protein
MTYTVELEVFGHLFQIDFTFIKGEPATYWEPEEGDELTIHSWKLINVENEEWVDETPESLLELADLPKEIRLTVFDWIYQ